MTLSNTVLKALQNDAFHSNEVDYLPGGAVVYMDSGSELFTTSVTLESNVASQSLALLPVNVALPIPCGQPEAPTMVGGKGRCHNPWTKWD